MQNRRYPKVYIRSKNEFAKHISHVGFPRGESLALINDVLGNFDKYWKDNKGQSEPEKEKFVRSAKHTPLGRLLDNINKKVLAPHDHLVPEFVFGGIDGTNHVAAGKHLLGKKRRRVALKMDITRFFEQVSRDRVYWFFHSKCGCDERASRLLADFSCVPAGPKNSGDSHKTIARGFATSSRLAVWCNLDAFIRLARLVQKRLKGRDPRLAIYVDDIGITASRVSKEEMEKLSVEIEDLLNSDPNQRLPINTKKTQITSHQEGIEHLGLKLNRNSLSIGNRTRAKKEKMKNKLKGHLSREDRLKIKYKHKSLTYYKKYVENKLK